MSALISEKKQRSISSLQGSAAFFGVPAIVLGVLLKEKYIAFGYAKPIISEMTDGYYGVMSGSLVGLLGICGWAMIRSRQVNVVVVYFFLLLACDALCVLDLLMVVPQVKARGEFAWDYSKIPHCNIHTRFRPHVDDDRRTMREVQDLRHSVNLYHSSSLNGISFDIDQYVQDLSCFM